MRVQIRLASSDLFSARRLCLLLISVGLSLIVARAIPAHAVEPDWTQYNIQFPPSPADGGSATASFSQRANIWLENLACGQENSFLETTLFGIGKSANQGGNTPNPKSFWSDGFLGVTMAKLQWLKLGHRQCNNTFNVIGQNVVGNFYDQNDFPDESHMEAQMAATFGSDCSGSTEAATAGSPFIKVKSVISAACLKAQINFVLNQVQELDTYPGTDPLPCNIVGNQKGDWDARMKALIRILFLDSAHQGDTGAGSMLTAVRPDGRTTRDYIQQDLITVDGGPGPDSYSWTACGDNEKSTGPPQDREDENSSSNDFWNSVGDALDWLCKRLILITIVLTVAGVLAAFGGITGLAAGVLAVIGIAAILAGQIPETENHRLMIESTRFINNQLIIQSLGPGLAPSISDAQGDVKGWLLNKFQSIAKNDFIEYNARPYQQYSLTALRNLADFSTDPDVRTGAQMLLEYSAAKFALGSNQGRRLVPFRRRLGAVSCILGGPCEECYTNGCGRNFYEIFHPKSYGDFQVSLGLLFNGQTQQLMNNLTPVDMADAPTATSQFVINPLITDLGIRKDIPYFERIHHAGYEVYSSSPSALITAGGIETDHANHFMLGPLPISTPFDPTEDIGGGLPTSVIFTGNPAGVTGPGQSRMTMGDFITFQGNLKTEGSEESFTDNLCVWRNFACGINLRMPTDLYLCLQHDPQTGPHWYFIDSSHCPGYTDFPKFFVALYLVCPQDICNGLPANNAGFLEVVDNPSDSFVVFENKVFQNNPAASIGNLGQGCVSGGDCKGRYHTVSGHTLDLELRGHQDDSEKTGITAVDGINEKDIDEWNFGEGDIMTSQGDGVILIRNPRLGTQVILDFGDVNHPCRRTGLNQPCTQQ